MVVLDVEGDTSGQGWVVCEGEGRYPDVIVELLSESTAADKGTKKQIYNRWFQTVEYFIFDPFDPTSLQGWHFDIKQNYQPMTPNEQGWLRSASFRDATRTLVARQSHKLGLWLGTWEGTIDRETAVWLGFYNDSGRLVPLPEEAEPDRLATRSLIVLQLG